MESKEERVLHALIRLGGAATGREISKLLGWDDSGGSKRVGWVMRRLIERGAVDRLILGSYRIKKPSRQ